jgi:hypothetical protein
MWFSSSLWVIVLKMSDISNPIFKDIIKVSNPPQVSNLK